MNARERLLVVSALLVFGLVKSSFADVLVLKDGTLIDGDVDSLLRGTNKAILTPDGRSVGLSDAVSTHLGVTAKELKAGIDRSSFISDGVRIDLVEAFIFETGEDEKREQFLQLNVNVTNRDERRYLSIETPRFFSNNYRWRLKDDVANKVRESHGDRVGELELLSSLDRIEPEKTANGAILFEPPLPKTEYLVLDLAPQMFEFNERLAFIGTAFLLIPFDSISTPERRLLAATEAVERCERTADDADLNVAKKLLDELAGIGEKGAAKLHTRWKLVSADKLVKRFRERFSQGEINEALADYATLRELSPQSADDVVVNLGEVPPDVLFELPADVLSLLPPSSWPTEKNSIGMKFKFIPGGTFTMGDRNVAHHVTLTRSFAIGVFEVTQEQFEQVMGTTPSKFTGGQHPVEQVSWDEAVEFCRKLSALPAEKKAGYVYRLPTEAEWEYACRAGTTTKYSFGDSESELGAYAWYDKNSGKTTHPVGGKKPNAWGLYDMHGNGLEWCQDWYGVYPGGKLTDPTGPSSGSHRVCRGGGWNYFSGSCRSVSSIRDSPGFRFYYLGFRVLRSSIK
jgi:formylglycine-generating enzyme required for sulfatase activity